MGRRTTPQASLLDELLLTMGPTAGPPPPEPVPVAPRQRSFDDLGTNLADVTFCVVDLETTGASPAVDAITEVGAVKVRGGEVLGTLRTFVDPGRPIPRPVVVLTGITEAMVAPAPPIAALLPTLLEFIGVAGVGCVAAAPPPVLVGHNLRFDVSFLDAALVRHGHARLALPQVDTCALARRLVRDEVRDCKLATLAERFRLAHRPSHRALDDALATTDLLHALLERAAAFGVLGLDDLLALPTMGGHPQAAKLRLTARLPRAPGVYIFRDRAGRALYVGKATDLRNRVRSYFSTNERRTTGPLLREVHAIDHLCTRSPLEAGVLEARLLHALAPRFNRRGIRTDRAAYVRLDLDEAFPRLALARSPSTRGRMIEVGPITSMRVARLVVEAIETVAPLRRCRVRLRRGAGPVRTVACTPAQLGVAPCPCAGAVTEADYAPVVARVVRALTREPALLLTPLVERITALAAAERFEEAADVRDRAAALAGALARIRRFDVLRTAGRVVLELPDGSGARLDRGILRATWGPGELPGTASAVGRAVVAEPPTPPPGGIALPAVLADELTSVAGWLDRHAGRVRLVEVEGEWATPLPRLPDLRPRPPSGRER